MNDEKRESDTVTIIACDRMTHNDDSWEGTNGKRKGMGDRAQNAQIAM